MRDCLYYRCWRGRHRFDATIYRAAGGWVLVIELVAGEERFVEFEQTNYWSALSAKLAMYTYFPYGTVKWNRIR